MKIYLASGNAHKVQEFQALANAAKVEGGVAIEFVSAKDIGGMPPVEEDTGTFVGNARKKALALRAKLEAAASPESNDEIWVLADDSGLCVDALGGAPGVESAYYAGPDGNSAANLRRLVDVMMEVPEGKRGAHFVCVLVLLGPGSMNEQIFEGRCEGSLLVEPRGGTGFGYDPLFVPSGREESLAEMGEALKNQISHRAQAARRLMASRWSEV
jgi:XTP/dITP diphosphohydrolase